MSKFDWHDLSPIFFDRNASSEPKNILETNKTLKHHLLAIH